MPIPNFLSFSEAVVRTSVTKKEVCHHCLHCFNFRRFVVEVR